MIINTIDGSSFECDAEDATHLTGREWEIVDGHVKSRLINRKGEPSWLVAYYVVVSRMLGRRLDTRFEYCKILSGDFCDLRRCNLEVRNLEVAQ